MGFLASDDTGAKNRIEKIRIEKARRVFMSRVVLSVSKNNHNLLRLLRKNIICRKIDIQNILNFLIFAENKPDAK